MKAMSARQYGGYLPLELPNLKSDFFNFVDTNDLARLNSGRATFYYAAYASKLKKVYLPYFTCNETKVPFEMLNVEIEHYFLDENLLPLNVELNDDEYILWTNYYGNASTESIDYIINTYKNLIIDNCHAFFSKPIPNAYNCYSARKFFGVADGAYLIKKGLNLNEQSLPLATSYDHVTHLIKQIDLDTNEGYIESLRNEERLNSGYGRMSTFTRKVLAGIDYSHIYDKRRSNFMLMHTLLGQHNEFEVNLTSNTHMYYPFLRSDEQLRYKLIENKVFNPFWWKHVIDLVPEKSIEHHLSKYMIMLPIDQRYNSDDILTICDIVMSKLV